MNKDDMKDLVNDRAFVWNAIGILKGLFAGLFIAAIIIQNELRHPIPDTVIENHLYFKEESDNDR